MPAEAKKLDAMLTSYLAAVDGQFPTPNPDYDPNVSPPPRKGGMNKEKMEGMPKGGNKGKKPKNNPDSSDEKGE